ncbi:MAG TPA: TlpA family protein disulfide reductase [Campylobacterales bacterium]|nr:TlpA family protein disulfide reductase [Campylobacterales bacterium]HHS93533.1 TlpA family protein disulfide reductase [Campylobacterales bacterium]
MIKLLTALLFALFLTACGDNNGEEKKFQTEPKTTETVKATEPEAKPTVETPKEPVKAEKTEKTETYAKNIFELTTITGEKLHIDEVENGISFQEHNDKVVFLIFFGYRCPPCLAEIPALQKIAAEKKDKLEVIGVEVQRLPEEQLKIFVESKKINYTVLSGEYTENSKFISYIAERAQWTGSIPFMVGIKPGGEVGMVHVGGTGYEDFKNVFNELSQ